MQRGPPARQVYCAHIELFNICEIHENELIELEQGPKSDQRSTFANLAIAGGSVFIPCLISLFVVDHAANPVAFNLYAFATVLTFILASVMLILWWRFPKPADQVLTRIRNRMDKRKATTTGAPPANP